MAINLITKTEPRVMERLHQESVTQGLFSNQYSFNGVRTIEIMSVDTVPLTAYDRNLAGTTEGTIGKRFGEIVELGDTKATYTMNDEVKYNIGFEKSTTSDQMNIKTASSIISRQDREVVVPYRDKYRLQALAMGAGVELCDRPGYSPEVHDKMFMELVEQCCCDLVGADRVRFD